MQLTATEVVRNVNAIQTGLLQERHSEKDFFLRLDATYIGKMEKGLAHFQAVVQEFVRDQGDRAYLQDTAKIISPALSRRCR